ncbi:MAG: CDP-diacylglycerol--serine O-phosphatidyltransferase [Bradymonadaceae bacterium]
MKVKKIRYIFPNLFTLANIFAGVYSIKLALTAEAIGEITSAAWLIVAAMCFDMFDGRVARMTDAESEFGSQMDSLTDAISFGVAPAMLMYAWGLTALGDMGVIFAFLYTCGAIMRLARFNVTKDFDGPSEYFLGLPTPLAAGTVVSVVLSHISVTGKFATGAYWNVAAMAVLLGGLMISNIRYRTFKDVDFKGRALAITFLLVGGASVVAIVVDPSVAMVIGVMLYIVLGIGGGIVHLSRSFFGDDTDEEPVTEERVLADARDDEH